LYLDRIAENASKVVEFCSGKSVEVCAVSKGVLADSSVVRAMVEGGCRSFADSRLDNLAILKKCFPDVCRTLLRIPMKSELKEAIDVADCLLVSMAESVEALDALCAAEGVQRQAILMFDLGDRREGILDAGAKEEESMEAFVRVFKRSPHVTLQGVGVNFGCFAGILPSALALRRLCLAKETLERELGRPIPICSGGSTSSLMLAERDELPKGVNHLRIGEAILLGRDVTWQRVIPWLRQDTAHLEAEVVEALTKPSLPEGDVGLDAFGGQPSFEDEGEQQRAIVAVGRQDVRIEGLSPMEASLRILGGSSDHMILAEKQTEGSKGGLHWGDVAKFSVDYSAMLALMTSPYVLKEYRFAKS
jgi:predicted amino acid racemase